jgi:hypothetical protein
MNDLKFALRQLVKNPAFTAVAVFTLALGLGANLAVVSLVNGLFFRPLPGLRQPGRLVILGSTYHKEGFGDSSYPDYRDLRERNSVFTNLAAFAEAPFSFSAENVTERLLGEMVSGNYFRTLGVAMTAGRDFLPEEDVEPGRNPVVIISERLWQRRWNRDARAIGRTVIINEPGSSGTCSSGSVRRIRSPSRCCCYSRLPLRCWPAGCRHDAPRRSTPSGRCAMNEQNPDSTFPLGKLPPDIPGRRPAQPLDKLPILTRNAKCS